MKHKTNLINSTLILLLIFFFTQCDSKKNFEQISSFPSISPDYTEVTVPCNIAPLNFRINEEGKTFNVIINNNQQQFSIHSKNGKIHIPEKKWKNIIQNSAGKSIEMKIFVQSKTGNKEFKPFPIYISNDSIDPYIAYRLIHPGYYSWSGLKIKQRSLENFEETSLVENQVIEKNCVNCHSFNQNNPDEFLIHIRGSRGGTYFVDGKKITKTDLKIETMPGSATYPAWHPGGKFVAFSSNQVRQNFYAHAEKSIEVYDLISTLILYDRETNEITNIVTADSINPMQTFPSWSPDGKYLYYCRAVSDSTNYHRDLTDIQKIHYDLVRQVFDENSKTFGEMETVFNAKEMNKSVSFPRISPDGKWLVFTLQDYGTFPIWHDEADLFLLDLETGEFKNMGINSDKTESYHSWSSNGKWLVFSSKRMDGRSARPFFAHFGGWENIGKPFVLPQKKPDHYSEMLESFNIPEFVSGKIKVDSRAFENSSTTEAIRAVPGKNSLIKFWKLSEEIKPASAVEKGIHE